MNPLPIAAAALLLTTSACMTGAAAEPRAIASAQLQSSTGADMGTARLYTEAALLRIEVDVSGLDNGAHGFHLHTTGDCDAPDFKSAGGHLNPYGRSHGTLSPGGSHLGDLPNLVAGDDGSASAIVTVSDTPGEAIDHIFDEDGTAVIIHAGPDDYRTDPAGAAGPRVACGVLMRQ